MFSCDFPPRNSNIHNRQHFLQKVVDTLAYSWCFRSCHTQIEGTPRKLGYHKGNASLPLDRFLAVVVVAGMASEPYVAVGAYWLVEHLVPAC